MISSNGRDKKTDWRLFAGLGIVVCFFLMTGFLTYSNILLLKKDAALVAHTHEVIIAIEGLLSTVKDAETGQRGYLLTGRESYLAPYEEARRLMDDYIRKLDELTRDNRAQQERLPNIKNLVSAKLTELASIIKARRKSGMEAALDLVETDHGKRVMDELRLALEEMRQTEHGLRMQRLDEMQNAYGVAITTGFMTGLLGIVLSMVIAGMLRRAAQQRRAEEWFQRGQVGLAKVMQGDLSVDQLGENILQFLAEYFDAQAGAFFAKDGHHYKRAATYGLPVDHNVPESFEEYGGLLAQAARDARAFAVQDVPEGYIKVGSALGEGPPRHLMIAPGLADGSVNAVLELGFMNPLEERAVELLDQVAKSIGVAVQSAHYRENLQRLLEETQSQAEELQTQSEELRVSNEELQRNEEELKTQQEELQAANEEMEEKAKILEEQNAQIRLQAMDIQDAKEMVEKKARELELSSKYKSEFLANMSHELRTPLNSLLILARSLAGNEDGNLTDEQVEEAKVIHNGGLELLGLINDILDLSKVEAGKLSVVAEDVSLHGIIKKMVQQFDPVAGEKNLAFDFRVDRSLPPTIYTDVQRVEQILKNLLSNAFKFTEAGAVVLEVVRTADDRVSFAVTDTGIGIDAAKLNDIFEAFQQEDGSIDRHYGGTGLGLTIARKFAHMLGGEISVTSQKGEGSTFTLILPLRMPAEKVNENLLPAPKLQLQNFSHTDLKKMPKTSGREAIKEFIADDRHGLEAKDKVLLIIEDDQNFAQTLSKMARKRGYKCVVAGDGKSGVLLASEYPVQAVILDLTLPDIDGINVLDQLKHDLKTRHIPVHIISGRTDMDNVVPLRKGAIGYLSKPVAAEDIDGAFGKIENLLQSQIKKILVVEDDKNSQAAIRNLLKKKDVEIINAKSGNAALKKITEDAFDCIILDLMLPDMTGFEWLEKIEAQAESEPPPVIVYTAKDLSEEENRRLNQYTGSIVIKGASSSERLLDEVTLFLHSVESTLTRDQQAMIRMQHDPDKVLQNRTALLVDDDMRNTFALSKLLKKHGMNVILADNGQMALDKLREYSEIEIVIMDIMMPVMDGYQAMRAMRAQAAFESLPVIALTARAMPEEQERCMEAGANDYLMKPVDVERLLTLLRVWLFRQEAAA